MTISKLQARGYGEVLEPYRVVALAIWRFGRIEQKWEARAVTVDSRD